MSDHVEVQDMDVKQLTAFFENEKLHREGLIVAAGEPTLHLMQHKLAPHRKATPSAVDSLTIANAPSRAGFIEIHVGAQGWRDFVLWFLNYGTRKQPARPWLEPSVEAIRPLIGERLAAFLTGKRG